jgi:hypothetical protein
MLNDDKISCYLSNIKKIRHLRYRRSVNQKLRHCPNILHTITYMLDTNSRDNETVERPCSPYRWPNGPPRPPRHGPTKGTPRWGLGWHTIGDSLAQTVPAHVLDLRPRHGPIRLGPFYATPLARQTRRA